MRLSNSIRNVRVGGVRIHALQQVIELDSGGNLATLLSGPSYNKVVQPSALRAILSQMAIVVPCMNEDISTIEGVLSGIPHDSLVILVSNTSQSNDYAREVEVLRRFSHASRRSSIAVHQQDAGLAAAFQAVGMHELIDPATGKIRSGKGEAMLVGTCLAAATGRRYLGFIDADNFVPGSVREYCEAFAAGLHIAQAGRQTGKAMVRLSWGSKPKVHDGKLVFSKEGRSSRVTNKWLNRLLAEMGDQVKNDIIATGNAGEHAMSMELAVKMRLAGGFAVEPFQYMDLLERFGSRDEELVEVLQIETRNPHLHQDKGDEHIKDMWAQALGVIHRSRVTPQRVRQQMDTFVAENDTELPELGSTRVYPPVESLDLVRLWELLEATLKVHGELGRVSEATECTSITIDVLLKSRDRVQG